MLGVAASLSAPAQQVYNSTGRLGTPKYRDNAQKKGFDVNRLVIGGGLGLGFGNGIFSFQVSPIVGYRFTNRFAAGIGLSYQYASFKDYTYLVNPNTNEEFYKSPRSSIISPEVWARFKVFDNLFVSAIGEYNFTHYTDYAWAQYNGWNIEKVKLNYSMPCLLLGVGYAQPITDNASFVIIASYDVLQKSDGKLVSDSRGNQYQVYSPYYRNLDLRIGFNIGF
jgi:hypothetical protein